MELVKQIQEFGLTEIEAKIYLSLLDKKESTVLELARNTGIKRATVHFNVENLIAKGLISQTRINNKRILMSEKPEHLSMLLEQRKSAINKLEGDLGGIISQLKARGHGRTDDISMQVRYFEGRDAVKAIYADTLNAKEIRSYVNLTEIYRVFPENIEGFSDALKQHSDLQIWEIVEHSEVALKFAKSFSESGNYYYRLTPTSITMTASDVLIYDGKVAVINLSDKIAGMVLENQEYYEISKQIFNFMWNVLPTTY